MRRNKKYQKASFTVDKLRQAMQAGIQLEMGGPTPAYRVLGHQPIPPGAHLTVVNTSFDAESSGGSTHIQADATRLPARSNTCDVVWASGLPDMGDTLRGAALEAWRILRPGGFFVWQAATAKALGRCHEAGFDVMHFSRRATSYVDTMLTLDDDDLEKLKLLALQSQNGAVQNVSFRDPKISRNTVNRCSGDFVFQKPIGSDASHP